MTEPTDETQPVYTPPDQLPTGPAAPAPSSPTLPLRADPNRPAASDWREPPWIPPRDRRVDRGPNIVAIVVGLVLIAVGLYYVLDVTLGISLPAIRWGSLWPLILILLRRSI